MVIAFPGESARYRAERNRLLQQEIELRRAMEAVAAARRQPLARRRANVLWAMLRDERPYEQRAPLEALAA